MLFKINDRGKLFEVEQPNEELAVRHHAAAQAPQVAEEGKALLVRAIEGKPGAWSVSLPKPAAERGYLTRTVQVTTD